MTDDPTMTTLPDYLGEGLNIVSIGLNPSIRSVQLGFYFAHPRNRFWPALNGSGLIPETLEPGIQAMHRLFEVYGIGFTDVVKRPTPGGAELRATDFKRWAPILREKLFHYRPTIAWFHGKQAYSHYLRHAEGVKGEIICWGEQERHIGNTRIFLTPNPSPANAAFSLDELIFWYRTLMPNLTNSD